MRKLPPRIDPKTLEELVKRLRDGDRSVEEQIILGHLRLGVKIAIRIGGYDDDLIGEAEYAIAKAVRQAARGALRDNNITGFIITWVKKTVKKFIAENRIMGVPRRTVSHWNKVHDERVRHLPMQVGMIQEDFNMKVDDSNQFISLRNNISASVYIVPESQSDLEEVEIRELLNMLPDNLIEKKILKLKEEGFTLKEIGQEIGYSISHVSRLVIEMEKKFEKLRKAIG